jgi:hypothetical protein
MNILAILNEKGRAAGLPFLVIGGHAVNVHGYVRQTADLDILVKGAEREAWKTLLLGLEYTLFHEQDIFAQFTPPAPGLWPVDLMFVNDQTFGKMHAASQEAEIQDVAVRVLCVEHLLALKLHALKHSHPRRELKDLLDVVNLIETNRIDIHGKTFKELCDRYGSEKIRDKIIAASSR